MPTDGELPEFFTPEQIAERLGISQRRLRADARSSGHCRIIGNRMLFTGEDVAALMEYWRPIPKSPHAARSSLAASMSGDYAQLLALRHLEKLGKAKRTPIKSRSTSRRGRG